jgi:outer membrane murein-binding lipoprotein Lpp
VILVQKVAILAIMLVAVALIAGCTQPSGVGQQEYAQLKSDIEDLKAQIQSMQAELEEIKQTAESKSKPITVG